MADMPWRFWSLDLKEGTRLVLAALWRHARSHEREEYLRRAGAPVFVWPSVSTVMRVTRRSQSSVEADLKTLRQSGLVERARRNIGGRVIVGWLLLASPADDAPLEADALEADDLVADPPPARGETPEDSGARVVGRPPSLRGKHPRVPGVAPPEDSGPEARVKPELKPSDVAPPTPTPVELEPEPELEPDGPPRRAIARRPHPDGPDGQPVGTTSSARSLLTELAHLHGPADVSRRFIVSSPRHQQLAEQLLAVAPAPGEDPGPLLAARFQLVVQYCHDFAQMVREQPKREQYWRPGMLSTLPAPGKTISAWEMLCSDVDTWRRAKRAERDEQAAAQQRRAIEQAEQRHVEQHRMDPAEVARQSAAFLGRSEDALRDEQARNAGRRREAVAQRVDQAAEELQRRINAALLEAMAKVGDRSLTAAERDAIIQRVRAESEVP